VSRRGTEAPAAMEGYMGEWIGLLRVLLTGMICGA